VSLEGARVADRAPHALRCGLTEAALQALDTWWEHLPAPHRRDLTETCAAAPNALRGLRVVGRFVDDDAEPHPGEGAFPVDFYEYLVNHEISLSALDGRTWHICTSHEKAAAAARAGRVPATFECPLRRPACPMRRVLAIGCGRSLRLEVLPE